MKKLTAGIIGLGVGCNHVRTIEHHLNGSVGMLCDFSPELSSWRPDYAFTSNAKDVLNNPSLNLVVIASFDNFHHEQIMAALANGKHVFAEKPLCLYRHEAEDIYKSLYSEKDLRLSANHVLRTCPRFTHLKQAIQNGELGDIYHLEADYYWGRPKKLTHGWRKDMPFYSIIHGAAVHMIDLLMWLTEEKPIAVSGVGNRIAMGKSEMKHNDFALLTLEFPNGMIAKVSAHGGCVHRHYHRVGVFGSKGTFLNEYPEGKWIHTANPEVEPERDKLDYPGRGARGEILSSFIDSIIDNNKVPAIPAMDVFDCMAVCFAAEEAVKTGKKQHINYF